MKRRMEQKSKNAISIIGGADGPTSIFIAGHSKKQPLKIRIKNSIYRYKRKKVEKTIVANPHSLSETVQYAKEKYGLTETAPGNREYIEQIKCLKESLILQYEPELLGEMKDIPVPDFSNQKTSDHSSVHPYKTLFAGCFVRIHLQSFSRFFHHVQTEDN